jgi:hypothetical protein
MTWLGAAGVRIRTAARVRSWLPALQDPRLLTRTPGNCRQREEQACKCRECQVCWWCGWRYTLQADAVFGCLMRRWIVPL